MNQAQPLFMPHKAIREIERWSHLGRERESEPGSIGGNSIWEPRSCMLSLSLSLPLISWWSHCRPTPLPNRYSNTSLETTTSSHLIPTQISAYWARTLSTSPAISLSLVLLWQVSYGFCGCVCVSVYCCAFYWFIWVLWRNLSYNSQRAEKLYVERWSRF